MNAFAEVSEKDAVVVKSLKIKFPMLAASASNGLESDLVAASSRRVGNFSSNTLFSRIAEIFENWSSEMEVPYNPLKADCRPTLKLV